MSRYDASVDNAINKLNQYHKIKREFDDWTEKLKLKEDNLTSVSGIRYDKEPSNATISHDHMLMIQLSNKWYLEGRMKMSELEWDYVNLILDYVEDEYQEMVRDKYVACMSWSEMEMKYDYSQKQLKRKIKKAIHNSLIIIQTSPIIPQ